MRKVLGQPVISMEDSTERGDKVIVKFEDSNGRKQEIEADSGWAGEYVGQKVTMMVVPEIPWQKKKRGRKKT